MPTLTKTPSITFDPKFVSEKSSSRTLRSNSTRVSREIETPHGPVQRDSISSSARNTSPSPNESTNEPRWPSGWRPYACLFGGFLLMFNSWGLVNSYGTFSSYYTQHLLPGHDILLLNLIGSTESFVVLALSAFVGRFLDAGYSRHLMIVGTLFLASGYFLLSIVNKGGNYGEGNYGLIWLTHGLLTGLGMACFFVSSSQVVATWFKKTRGFAIGIVASGASIAGLIYPLMTKFLITEVGFNNAVRYVATVITVTSILAIVIVNPNPAHEYRKPEKWTKLSVFVDTSAFKNPSFMWLCAAISILFFGFYAVFFNLEEWAAVSGLGYKGETPGGLEVALPYEVDKDAIRTYWLLCIMNASSTVGRLGSSYLCDQLGALNVHAAVTFVASLLVLLLWTMAKTVRAAVAFVVVFGIFSGAVIGLPPASVAYILGEKDQAKLGQWTGMMYSCASVFALTGPVIAGHLITEYGNNFLTVQLWSGACLFLSACCLSISVYCRQKRDIKDYISAHLSTKSSGLGPSSIKDKSRLSLRKTSKMEQQSVSGQSSSFVEV